MEPKRRLDSGGGGTACFHFLCLRIFSSQNPEKLCAPSLYNASSTSPTLAPFPYSNLLLSQLRHPFPLSRFPVLPSPTCGLPPSPRPRHCGFPFLGHPAPSPPRDRSHGRDSLQLAILCSLPPIPTLPSSAFCQLGLGTSGWRVEPLAPFLPAIILPRSGRNPPLKGRVRCSRWPTAVASGSRPCRLQTPPQALRDSFPGRPRTVFRSLG